MIFIEYYTRLLSESSTRSAHIYIRERQKEIDTLRKGVTTKRREEKKRCL